MEKELVLKIAAASIKAKERFFTKKNAAVVAECAEMIAASLNSGGKLMLAGNGGSAADAQHMAGEFVNRFLIERPPLPAVALTTDTSVLTSIGNDYGFEQVFSKQVKALGKDGDVLIAISTSGESKNVIKAVEAAMKLGMGTIAFTGATGGKLAEKADIVVSVNSDVTPRVQEVHITVAHIICELVDHILFGKVSE